MHILTEIKVLGNFRDLCMVFGAATFLVDGKLIPEDLEMDSDQNFPDISINDMRLLKVFKR